jgi:cytochrome c oxidase subunit III
MARSSVPGPLQKVEKLHPHLTLLYSAIIGSSLLFFFLLLSLVMSLVRGMGHAVVPKFFIISTLVILVASWLASRLGPNFARDQVQALRSNLQWLLGCGVVFTVSQALGWHELFGSGVKLTKNNAGALLYLLSGLHLLHLLGGLAFNWAQWRLANRMATDPVKALLVFSSQYERTKMKMLAVYWHFLDAAWIVIFLILLFTL